jgi:hypothetical protein
MVFGVSNVTVLKSALLVAGGAAAGFKLAELHQAAPSLPSVSSVPPDGFVNDARKLTPSAARLVEPGYRSAVREAAHNARVMAAQMDSQTDHDLRRVDAGIARDDAASSLASAAEYLVVAQRAWPHSVPGAVQRDLPLLHRTIRSMEVLKARAESVRDS